MKSHALKMPRAAASSDETIDMLTDGVPIEFEKG